MLRSVLAIFLASACAPADDRWLPADVLATPTAGFELWGPAKAVLGGTISLRATYPGGFAADAPLTYGWSTQGTGQGVCPPNILHGACLDIVGDARRFGTVPAVGRTSTLYTVVPSTAASTNWMQVANLDETPAILSEVLPIDVTIVGDEIVDIDNAFPNPVGIASSQPWQSFTATSTGIMRGFEYHHGILAVETCTVISLLEGEGTTGRLLSEVEVCTNLSAPVFGQWHRTDFLDDPWVEAGEIYTLRFDRTIGTAFSALGSISNPYPDGRSSSAAHDLNLRTFVLPEETL